MTKIERAGRILQLWGWVYTAMIAPLFYIFISDFEKTDELEVFIIGFLFLLILIGVFTIYIGRTLKLKKLWVKTLSLVISFLSLFLFPIGTIFGALTIMYIYQDWNEQRI